MVERKKGAIYPNQAPRLRARREAEKMKEWSSKIVPFVSTCIPDISNILDPNSRKLKAEACKWENHPSENLDYRSWASWLQASIANLQQKSFRRTSWCQCSKEYKKFHSHFFTRKNSFQPRGSLRSNPIH